jgi:hypothetical protein
MVHLTPEQIERYASRSGDVDEILAAAQHFEVCHECRDRAAALLDPGTGEVSHTRRVRRVSGARPALAQAQAQAIRRQRRVPPSVVIWIVFATAAMMLVAFMLLRR